MPAVFEDVDEETKAPKFEDVETTPKFEDADKAPKFAEVSDAAHEVIRSMMQMPEGFTPSENLALGEMEGPSKEAVQGELKSITPEFLERGPFGKSIVQPTRNAVSGLVSGLANPQNLEAIALAGVPGLAKPVAASFLPSTIRGTVEGGKQTYQDIQQGNFPAAVEHGETAVASGLMTGALAHGVLSREVVVPKLEESGSPQTAQVIDAMSKEEEPKALTIPEPNAGGEPKTSETPPPTVSPKTFDELSTTVDNEEATPEERVSAWKELENRIVGLTKDEDGNITDYTEETPGTIQTTQADKIITGQEAMAEQAGMDTEELSGTGMTGTPTSIKNAVVDQERAARGLPAAMQPARQSFGDFWDQSMSRINSDPKYQDQLIDELIQNPRAVTAVEDATLLHRQVDLQNQYRGALEDVDNASKAGDEGAVNESRARAAGLRDDLYDLYEVNKHVGTETGRGLVARRMLANEDFSLAQMEADYRSAKPDGEALTDEEVAKTKKFSDKIEETQKAIDKHVEEAPGKRVDEFIKNETETPPEAKSLSDRIIDSLSKKANDARARLKERLARTSAGIDPTILSDLAIIGAEHIARGIRTFADWSKRVMSDFAEFGEKIKPYLEDAFKKSSELVDEEVKTASSKKKTPAEAIKDAAKEEGAQPTDVKRFVQKLALDLVRSGVTDREALIDQVHAVLKEAFPEITRRESMDAISGYGDWKALDKEEAKVTLRKIKGESQQLAKIEDIEAGKPLQKTGIERREMSDEERRLQKKVNEAKKKHGVVVTDPETQLKSIQAATATRLRNRINDLRYEIETGEKIVKGKTVMLDNEEIAALRKEKAEVQALHDEIFKKRDEEADATEKESNRIKRRAEELKKKIGSLEQQLKTGEFEAPKGQKANRPDVEELEKLKQQREALQKQADEAKKVQNQPEKEAEAYQRRLDAMDKAIEEKKSKISAGDVSTKAKPVNRPLTEELEKRRQELDALNKQISDMRKGPELSDYEKRLKATKSGMARSTAEYERRIREGDFGPRPKKPAIELDKEAQDLKAKNIESKQAWMREVAQKQLEGRSRSEKVLDTFSKWFRFSILSNPAILAKLTMAAAHRAIFTAAEEGVGGALSHVPGLSSISEMAPRHGGFSSEALAKYYTEGFTSGMKDSWDTLKTGQSSLSRVYGKGGEGGLGERMPLDASVLDFAGHVHAALKAPIKRAEFALSFQKRMEFEIRNGNDPSDPYVQMRVAMDAYKDANRAIFMQDSKIVTAYNAALRTLEAKEKSTGHTPVGDKLKATAIRTVAPIVKVPSNIASELFEYTMGSVIGTGKAMSAIKSGVEKLTPDQADIIMRQLKKGLVGNALLVTGYLLYKNAGGVYVEGEKRNQNDVPQGAVKIGNVTIQKNLLHSPGMEELQLGATIARTEHALSHGKANGIADGLAVGALGMAEEQPFIGDMIRTAKGWQGENKRNKFFGGLARSATIPGLIQWAAQYEDQKPNQLNTVSTNSPHNTVTISPNGTQPSLNPFAPYDVIKRDPKTFLDNIKLGIPGYRETVPKSAHQNP